jgi:hypothetical protein
MVQTLLQLILQSDIKAADTSADSCRCESRISPPCSCFLIDPALSSPGPSHRKVVGYRIIPGGDNLDGEGHGTHVGGSICGQVGRVFLTLASCVHFAMRSGQCGSLFKWQWMMLSFLHRKRLFSFLTLSKRINMFPEWRITMPPTSQRGILNRKDTPGKVCPHIESLWYRLDLTRYEYKARFEGIFSAVSNEEQSASRCSLPSS